MKNLTLLNLFGICALVVCVAAAVALYAAPFSTHAGLVDAGTAISPSGALPDSGCPSCNTGLIGTDTGVGVSSPISATLPGGSSYSQSSYYRQGSYASGYAQGSYPAAYAQGSYTNFGDSCSGGSIASSCGEYSQGAYFTCPSGFRVFQGRSCCPAQYYAIVDTNGSAKGGNVEQCNIPDTPSTPTPPTTPTTNNTPTPPAVTTASCTVNGTAVPHGSTYTFYTEGTVPYGQSCSSVAYERTCNNGLFSGNNNGYTNCGVGPAPEIGAISITANPDIVRYGDSSTIIWDGANSEACTVTGYGITNGNTVTGSQQVDNVQSQSTYILNCTLGPNTKSASTTLKVLPISQET